MVSWSVSYKIIILWAGSAFFVLAGQTPWICTKTKEGSTPEIGQLVHPVLSGTNGCTQRTKAKENNSGQTWLVSISYHPFVARKNRVYPSCSTLVSFEPSICNKISSSASCSNRPAGTTKTQRRWREFGWILCLIPNTEDLESDSIYMAAPRRIDEPTPNSLSEAAKAGGDLTAIDCCVFGGDNVKTTRDSGIVWCYKNNIGCTNCISKMPNK